MRFDTVDFLEGYGIPYADRGPNCAQGHVVINCPLCTDDPSKHLGINMETGAWSCWRDYDHRGNNPAGFIQPLLKCSWAEAQRIVHQYTGYEMPDFTRKEKKPEAEPQELVFEDGIRSEDKLPVSYHSAFRRYMEEERGIFMEEASDFEIMYGLAGRWAYRVVFPYYEEGKLVCWTARGITESMAPKYLSLTPQEGALHKAPDSLWGYDYAMQPGPRKRLFVVEGPFDALKLNVLFRAMGIPQNRAVCLSTAVVSNRQAALLTKMSKSYESVYLMLDQGFYMKALPMCSKVLSHIPNFQTIPMVTGFKDAGEFSELAVEALLSGIPS